MQSLCEQIRRHCTISETPLRGGVAIKIYAIAHGIGPAARGSWLVQLIRFEGNLVWKAGAYNLDDVRLYINRQNLPNFSFQEDWKVAKKQLIKNGYPLLDHYDFSYIPFKEEHLNEDKRN